MNISMKQLLIEAKANSEKASKGLKIIQNKKVWISAVKEKGAIVFKKATRKSDSVDVAEYALNSNKMLVGYWLDDGTVYDRPMFVPGTIRLGNLKLEAKEIKIYLNKGDKPPKGKKAVKGPKGGTYFMGTPQEKKTKDNDKKPASNTKYNKFRDQEKKADKIEKDMFSNIFKKTNDYMKSKATSKKTTPKKAETKGALPEKQANAFIKHIEDKLSWNGAQVTDNKDGTFTYNCYAGQSVSKDIKDAAKKVGFDVSVKPIEVDRGAPDHEYLIKVNSTTANSHKNSSMYTNQGPTKKLAPKTSAFSQDKFMTSIGVHPDINKRKLDTAEDKKIINGFNKIINDTNMSILANVNIPYIVKVAPNTFVYKDDDLARHNMNVKKTLQKTGKNTYKISFDKDDFINTYKNFTNTAPNKLPKLDFDFQAKGWDDFKYKLYGWEEKQGRAIENKLFNAQNDATYSDNPTRQIKPKKGK